MIDLTVPPDWARTWAGGGAWVVAVAPTGEVSPDWERPAGAYDPARHLHVGQASGQPVFAVIESRPGQVRLRDTLTGMEPVRAEVAMRASALVQFHATNPYCPQCGGPTAPAETGHSRACARCDAIHFPRTDPAVIVAVTDAEGRLLLGHHAGWESTRYSVFAGFVEAGESLEQTVHREVAEEVGLTLTDVAYAGSQPWPMPRSLMVAFTARALDGVLHPDGAEIEAARWFSRAGLDEAVARGEITLPAPASIAHRLVSRWYAG